MRYLQKFSTHLQLSKKYHIPLLILLSLALSFYTFVNLDPDFGWHVYLGDNFLNHGLVQHLVGYNSFHNVILPDHEWLSDLLLALGYNKFGYFFIVIIFFLVTLLFFWLLFKNITARLGKKASPYIIFSGLLLLLAPLTITYGIRIQVVLFLAAIILELIPQKFKDRFSLRLTFYGLIFAIGNNLHGGFLILLPIVFLNELDLLTNLSNKDKIKRLAILIIVLLTSISINPYGLKMLPMIKDYATGSYLKRHIQEWCPTFTLPTKWLQAVVPLFLFLFIETINGYFSKLSLWKKLLLLGYLYLGVAYVRFFCLFAIINLPYFLEALTEFMALIRVNLNSKKLIILPMLALITPVYFASQIHNYYTRNLYNPAENERYPYAAMDFLERQHYQNGNFLNPFNWGGYILGFYPDQKVFIDGRGPQLKIDSNTTLLQESDKFFSEDKNQIKEKLVQYNIGYVLIQKPSRIRTGNLDESLYSLVYKKKLELTESNNLQKYLASSSQWKLVYDDNIAQVYLKK